MYKQSAGSSGGASEHEDISVTLTLTEPDFILAQRTYLRKRRKARRNRLIVFAGCVVLTPPLVVVAHRLYKGMPFIHILTGAQRLEWVMPLIWTLFAVAVVVSAFYLIARRRALIRRLQRGLRRRASLCTYHFGDVIEMRTPHDSACLEYDNISEVIEDFYGLLIVPYVGDCIYLPTRVLYGESLVEVKRLLDERCTSRVD